MFTFQVTDTCEIWLIKEMSQRAINEKKKPKTQNQPTSPKKTNHNNKKIPPSTMHIVGLQLLCRNILIYYFKFCLILRRNNNW